MASQTLAEKNAEHFDQQAATWDDKPHVTKLAQEAGAAMTSLVQLTPNTVAVEFGCGTGILSECIASRVGRIVGIDTSAQMVNIYNSKAKSKGMANMTATCLDILDDEAVQRAVSDGTLPAFYDLVLLQMCLHHVEDVPQVLSKLAARLKPDGEMVMADILKTPDSMSFHTHNVHTVAYPGGFSEQDLQDMLSAAGMKLATFKGNAFVMTREKTLEDGAVESKDHPIFLAVASKKQ
jgi:2-polyprenyl-3-methyl-5-hydroxy-6-metoxy-1,4-benzoquinol methylase